MRKRNLGFTLIELMITVAVVAILAAIAYPSYQQQILKSNRTVAKNALLTAAQSMEKCYTQNGRYTGCPVIASMTNSSEFDSGKALYAIQVTVLNATTFTARATAQGAQAGDANCTWFQIDNTNLQTATDGGGTTCWR